MQSTKSYNTRHTASKNFAAKTVGQTEVNYKLTQAHPNGLD